MQALNRRTARNTTDYPEKILQFGGGNFLRGFFAWMVHRMNRCTDFNAGITVVQSVEQVSAARLEDQDGLYHLYLHGMRDGQPFRDVTLIDCIGRALSPNRHFDDYFQIAGNPDLRFVVSNTTEAGIVFDEGDTPDRRPQRSYPGKLAAFLYRRYRLFSGAADKGLIIFCCELIEGNGDTLKQYVLEHARRWGLDTGFLDWIVEANVFCNTLVDRIVPGYPADRIDGIQRELGYRDEMVVEGEHYHLWVIEAPPWVEEAFPARRAGLNVIFTDDLSPYRERKLRVLNGAHTASFAVSRLHGLDTVRESVEDSFVGRFMREVVFDEIGPNMDMPQESVRAYAEAVFERFHNPYIKHRWQSIALNAVSKWRIRLLPSLLDYQARTGALPERIVFSLAALIAYYRAGPAGRAFELQDDPDVIDVFQKAWSVYDGSRASLGEVAGAALASRLCWQRDLNAIDGLAGRVADHLFAIETRGLEEALAPLLRPREQTARRALPPLGRRPAAAAAHNK
jgi:tagaturonate reductase